MNSVETTPLLDQRQFLKSLPIADEVRGKATEVFVPHQYLHGIQEPSEYRRSRLQNIYAILKNEGIQHLLAYPILTTILHSSHEHYLVILDGHHRARIAPRAGIERIPTFIIELQELSSIFSIEAAVLSEKLFDWIYQSIEAFEKTYAYRRKVYIPPRAL